MQFILSWLCLICILSCNPNSKDREDPKLQNPDKNPLNLIPGSEAFLKFKCSIQGEDLKSDNLAISTIFTPLSDCPNLALRQIGSAFQSYIVKILVDSDQNSYLLMSSSAKEDWQKFYGKFSLVKIDSKGKQIFEIQANENNVFESFALHPSGEITIAETRKVSDENELGIYHVWLRRISKDGKLKFERPLKDSTLSKSDNGSPRVFFYAGSIIIANGEETYLASNTDKAKVYSLTEDYQVKWSYQYIPAYRFVIAPGNAKLFLDKERRLILGQTIHQQEVLALEKFFGETIPNKDGILVYRFSADAREIEHKVIDNESAMDLAGIHADDNIITFGADIRIKKFNESNHSYERDLNFVKFNIANGSVLINKVIDLERDDAASDFIVDHEGNGIFVGNNNYVQVDSHSVVEFGKAYILQLDPEGNTKHYISFNGPRNTSLGSVILQESKNNTLILSGLFDSPITHTGDNDPSLRYQKAMIGSFVFKH